MQLREIDRELIYLRREEANACMHYRLFHAATLTAGSGFELLLECLVGDVYRAFAASPHDAQQAEQLHYDLKYFVPTETKGQFWGLGTWIRFFEGYQIPLMLQTGLDYNSDSFDFKRLHEANRVYVKAKHEPFKVTVEDAREVLVYFDMLLDEVGILTVEDRGKLEWRRTWGERIRFWTVQDRDSAETLLLLNLLPLLDTIERLIRDQRVGYEHKTRLMLAENYVYSTIDLVKEDERKPHSLVDDAAVLALTLYWLLRQPTFDNSILHACWQRDTHVEDEVEHLYKFIVDNRAKLFPDTPGQFGRHLIWEPISRIATDGPEALWQNYWKEAY